jgi:hypothetical protein
MKFGGCCAYCGVELTGKWHADHVKAVRYDFEYRHSSYELGQYKPSRMVKNGKMLHPENDVLDNLFPACVPCNIDKGAENLEDWRNYLQNRMIDVMRRDIPNFRHAERFDRITVSAEPLRFWFEEFNEILKAVA